MNILTHYPEVNQLLQTLLKKVRAILDDQFVGMYLFGSLTNDTFDEASDIDVLIVTREAISDALFAALQAMHAEIYAGASPWTIQLEVAYIPQRVLRRYDPDNALHPHIDRGSDRFFRKRHDESWIVQRHVLYERGVTLVGPAPQTLIDPVSPDDLRRTMLAILEGWKPQFLEDPARLNHRGGQSYIVLTICRILYTLELGTAVSKQVAAKWALETTGKQWRTLIERAWVGRHNPGLEVSSDDVVGTLAFLRYARAEAHNNPLSRS
ncbi:MAG: DUF4111 domain-containing protein [Chloroflexi bacterium]|nr:DUF4111 domain-containing protein [Chloroflexota bacterium]